MSKNYLHNIIELDYINADVTNSTLDLVELHASISKDGFNYHHLLLLECIIEKIKHYNIGLLSLHDAFKFQSPFDYTKLIRFTINTDN